MYKRGVLWAPQTATVAVTGIGAIGSSYIPLNYVIEADITRTLNKDDAKYLRYKEWLLKKRIVLDRIGAWKLTIDCDFSEVGYFLKTLFGAAVKTGNTHLFKDTGGATRKPGTLAIVTEDASEWDRAPDCWVMDMKWSGDPRGRVRIELSGPCWAEPPVIGSPPTWTPTAPPDRSPISGWQNLIKINAAAVCMESWSLTLHNDVTPRICSPPILPDASTPEGAVPGNWQFAGLSGAVDGTLDYDGYSGSPLESYMAGTQDGITMQATDAKTIGLGYTPGLLITLNAIDWDKSDKLYPKDPLSLQVAGAIADTATFAVSIALTNGVTSYGS